MYRHIKKPIKKSLTDDLSKGLLEIECESNPSIKSKRLKWIDKKIIPNYKEKKHAIENKTDENWEKN